MGRRASSEAGRPDKLDRSPVWLICGWTEGALVNHYRGYELRSALALSAGRSISQLEDGKERGKGKGLTDVGFLFPEAELFCDLLASLVEKLGVEELVDDGVLVRRGSVVLGAQLVDVAGIKERRVEHRRLLVDFLSLARWFLACHRACYTRTRAERG